MKIRIILSLSVLSLFMLTIGCQKQSSVWKGTIKKENDVLIVKNPKEPMYTADVFSLEEDLSITEADGGDKCIFSRIRSIDIDESGRIYILEYQEAHVYVFGSKGNYIKTFGRKGQGPGELNLPVRIKITSRKEIAVSDLRKGVNFYTMEGDFIRELLTAKVGGLIPEIDSEYNLFGTVIVRDEENPRYELVKFDPEMNRLHSFASSPLPIARNEVINPFAGSFVYSIRQDDHIIYGNPQNYEIDVFDPQGNLILKIVKDYDPVEITEEEKEQVLERMPEGIKVSIPRCHNPFSWFIIDDEGRIFVTTHELAEEGEGLFYDVFDSEGRCLAKIPFKNQPYLIKKNKLYTVESDDEGFLSVKRYQVDWNI